MTAIVLVHGSFHGGWCWREAAARLRALGHDVFTPTLTGLGERSHLISAGVNLDVHIQDVVNVILWEELRDVVLLGHSYGGMPITGAADQIADRLSALVYLDAFTPEDGASSHCIRTAEPGHVPLVEPADGIAMPPPAAEAFGVGGALAAWVDRRMTAHPFPTMTQPISLTGACWTVPKKLYVRCRGYPAPHFDRYHAQADADPGWLTVAGDWPHNIMMTDPDQFVDLLCAHALG